MALFICKECGNEREGRCKPRKCPDCGASGSYEKKRIIRPKNNPAVPGLFLDSLSFVSN